MSLFKLRRGDMGKGAWFYIGFHGLDIFPPATWGQVVRLRRGVQWLIVGGTAAGALLLFCFFTLGLIRSLREGLPMPPVHDLNPLALGFAALIFILCIMPVVSLLTAIKLARYLVRGLYD